MCSLKKWEIKATLQVNPCQHFLLSPQGFLLTVPSLQVQNVPAQIFKGVLVSFTSDHHLADSCSARLWETTVTWELEHKWFCLKGRDLPALVSYTPLSPSPILATMFIYCLHSSISQSWFAIFPFPPFFVFHTWNEGFFFFLYLMSLFFLLSLAAGSCDAGESCSTSSQRRPGSSVRRHGHPCSLTADSNHSTCCLRKLSPVLI